MQCKCAVCSCSLWKKLRPKNKQTFLFLHSSQKVKPLGVEAARRAVQKHELWNLWLCGHLTSVLSFKISGFLPRYWAKRSWAANCFDSSLTIVFSKRVLSAEQNIDSSTQCCHEKVAGTSTFRREFVLLGLCPPPPNPYKYNRPEG